MCDVLHHFPAVSFLLLSIFALMSFMDFLTSFVDQLRPLSLSLRNHRLSPYVCLCLPSRRADRFFSPSLLLDCFHLFDISRSLCLFVPFYQIAEAQIAAAASDIRLLEEKLKAKSKVTTRPAAARPIPSLPPSLPPSLSYDRDAV